MQRHPRTSQSNTPEKSASESDAEKGTGASQSTPPGGGPEKEPQPSPPTHTSDQKEEGAADVMIISDADSHSPESLGGAKSPRSGDDLWCSGRGSQVKAARMSEVGIFERFSQGCASASEHTDQPASETEEAADKPPALCSSSDREAGCSADNKDASAKCSSSPDSAQHDSGTGQDLGGGESSSLQPADSTLPSLQVTSSTAASQVTKTSTGSDFSAKSPSVSPSIRSPSSVSRNLFETFLAISQSEDQSPDEGEDERPLAERSGDTGGVQTGDTGEGCLRDGNVRRSASGESSNSETAAEGVAQRLGCGPSESTGSSHEDGGASTSRGAAVDRGASGDGTPRDNAPTPASSSGGDNATATADREEAALTCNSVSVQSGSPLRSASTGGSPEGSAATERDSASGVVQRRTERHVSVSVSSGPGEADSRAVVPRYERPFPRDFNTIRMKLEADKYTSVVSRGFVAWQYTFVVSRGFVAW